MIRISRSSDPLAIAVCASFRTHNISSSPKSSHRGQFEPMSQKVHVNFFKRGGERQPSNISFESGSFALEFAKCHRDRDKLSRAENSEKSKSLPLLSSGRCSISSSTRLSLCWTSISFTIGRSIGLCLSYSSNDFKSGKRLWPAQQHAQCLGSIRKASDIDCLQLWGFVYLLILAS